MWCCRWNEIWQGKPKYSEETALVPLCPQQIPHGSVQRSNPGPHDGKIATNRLSYGTTEFVLTIVFANKNHFQQTEPLRLYQMRPSLSYENCEFFRAMVLCCIDCVQFVADYGLDREIFSIRLNVQKKVKTIPVTGRRDS
jgi:hypothetical protein